jgi:hypothetical protein
MNVQHTNITDALTILKVLGLPRAQINERSALCLLALLNIIPGKTWSQCENPLMGITPMMDFSRINYGKEYAPNSRESFRRGSMHQFVDAGIALYNPDNPTRSVNSPKAVYQIAPDTLALIKQYGTDTWNDSLDIYLSKIKTLVSRYAKEREFNKISVIIDENKSITLTPGNHSDLIKAIIEEFAPRFVPGGVLIYAGDTGSKFSYFNEVKLAELGIKINSHGKMPDVIIYFPEKNWLLLIESVTSHGPVDGKRHNELIKLFAEATAGLVYVTAFPSRSIMARYVSDIAWETEVWIADAPSHLIHFNGVRFLGPYNK